MKKLLTPITKRAAMLIGFFSMLTLTTAAGTDNPSDAAEPVWQQQLQNGLRIGRETDRPLKLVGYEYLGTVTDEDEIERIIGEIFGDDCYTAVTQTYADGHKDYELRTWGKLRENYEYYGMVVRDQMRRTMIYRPTDVIQLTWSHNGHTFRSKALATPDGGIIYDNIGTYAVYDTYIIDKEGENNNRKEFGKDVSSVNIIDLPLWEVNLSANSTFDTEGILRDFDSSNSSSQSAGWECSGTVGSDNGKINESKYNAISWKYSYNDNRGAQYVVTRDGYPTGGGSASGTITHTM